MCADFSKESKKNGTFLMKSQARLRPINRAFGDDFIVESANSECLPASKIQSYAASIYKDCGSLKSQEPQLSLKKKIEELRSSFFAAQDFNVEDNLEASRKGIISQIPHRKNAAEIPSRCCAKSENLLTFQESTINKFQFSSSLNKLERYSVSISAQKRVSCFQKSQGSFSKTGSNYDAEPQENDQCSKRKAEGTCHSELSVQEHTLSSSCHENFEYFSSATNSLQESCRGAFSSSFSTSQDSDIRYKKKLKKSHSFEFVDQTSHPNSFRKENCTPNSSIQSSKEYFAKNWSVLTSKPQDLHCRFKRQFNQLHSSFFPEQELCSASLEEKNPDSLSSDQKSQNEIRTSTFDSTVDEVSESTNSVTKEPSRTKPMLGGTCVRHTFVHHSPADSAIPTNTETVTAQPRIISDDFIPTQVVLKAHSHTTINSDSNAEAAKTSHTDMTVRKNELTGNSKGGMCLRNNFTPDFLIIPECKNNQNSDLNSEADLSTLYSSQVCVPADDNEKTTSLAKVFRKTIIQRKNAVQPEQNPLLDLRQNENEGECVEEAESASSKALYLPDEKINKATSQKLSEAEPNLNSEQVDLNHHTVVSERKNEKFFPPTGTFSKPPKINPGSEPCLLASTNLGNFQQTKNECKQIQKKNLELSVNEFKVPLPSVSKPKKSVSFQKNGNSGLNEQDSDELALLLADISEEFFSQLGTTPNKKTDEENFASKSSSTPCEIPYLTVKEPGLENQTCSDRSLAQLLIVDLLRVTPTFRRNHYMFHNLVVHHADVFGVVTGVRPVGDEKILYEVDDGSGSISCMYRTTRTGSRLKKLTDFLHQRGIDETFNQTGDTIMDESSVEQSSQRENAFKQLKTCMENYLAASDEELFYQIGDTIHANGVLYNFRDTLSFYIYNIRKVKNMAEETDRYFHMAALYNSTYPKIIEGFKT